MSDLESDFNLKVVLVSFKQCLNEKEEVLLEHYLAGWRGLVRCVQGAAARGRGPPVCTPMCARLPLHPAECPLPLQVPE